MNILFISPSIPSQLHRIRSYELIKSLSEIHNVHVISLDVSNGVDMFPEELKRVVSSYEIIGKSKWRSIVDCVLYIFSPSPLEVAYCHSKKMERAVKEVIAKKNIDLIYIKRLRSFQFLTLSADNVPVVIDTTDAMSLFYDRASKSVPWYKKPLFFEEYFKYSWYEKKLATQDKYNIKKWIVCSSIDRDYLRDTIGIKDIAVVPNIVDTEFYDSDKVNYVEEKRSLVISGLMDKFVNTEAVDFLVKEVLPIVRKSYPTVKLYIVGPNPTKRVRSYENNNIIVTGYVKDLREYIMKAEVFVCTVKTGTGTRFKILQALAMKKPVVSTRAGFEGLDGKNGKEILLADTVGAFAESIIELFNDNDLKRKIGQAGRELVEVKYSRSALKASLEKELLVVDYVP